MGSSIKKVDNTEKFQIHTIEEIKKNNLILQLDRITFKEKITNKLKKDLQPEYRS